MHPWTRLVPALVVPAALAAALRWPVGPAWIETLLVLLAVAAVARAFGWAGAAVGTAAAFVALARPWASADPLMAWTAVPGSQSAGLIVAALAGRWIGGLERHLGAQRAASVRAQYDPLTGLLNRTAFEGKVEAEMRVAKERGDVLALLFVDLDRFKVVNDTYGHEVGDALLARIGSILRTHVRQGDLVGRLGGDEFTVALRGLREAESAEAIAYKLLEVLDVPHEVAGRHIEVGASIGIAVYPKDGADVAALLKNADHAMYQVKEAGRHGVGFTNAESRVRKDRRLEVERQLRAALHEDEFELHYQPKFHLKDGVPTGVEMLLRWRNAKLGLVSPAEFVPMAEETGMILPLGRWILRQACFQLAQWDAEGLPAITLAVNVSTLQFRQADFVKAVEDALADSRIDPARLELEVTESVLMKDFAASLRTLKRLDKLGVRIALDDFGTGYSSLQYLQHLPIHTLKIDRSFVAGLKLRQDGPVGGTAPIVETIVTLGHKLDLEIIAEGIETRAQMQWLRDAGCHSGQGFLFCKPQPANRIERLIARVGRPLPPRFDVGTDGLLMTN